MTPRALASSGSRPGNAGIAAVLLLVAGGRIAATAAAPAPAASADAGSAFFENRIRPVLVERCYSCHSAAAKKIRGGLRLDTRQDFLQGGTNGVIVVAGQPDRSRLIRAVRYEDQDLQMPPNQDGGKRLPAAAIADLVQWVKMGAPYPETPGGGKRVASRPWAFEPIRSPPRPAVRNLAWPSTSLDPFILAQLEARGLQPAPPADRRALIRRATFDLTGLPPTPAEIEAFVGDRSGDAFARVVDRLLSSPHYGEHWGRHWLDVARYADTAGDTADYPVPEAWRYRNYVIDSFNADQPYDEFVREQIAGDILARRGPPGRYAQRVEATGYLALSRRFGFDSENYQHLTIQDTIDTLGQSILGLTLGCARCHDHKFDPISMQDYYGLYGVFESTRYAFPGSEQKGRYRALVPLVPESESGPAWHNLMTRYAALGLTPGSVLRSLDDLDGDFEMQKFASGGSYGVLVPPWFYEGKVGVAQGAQSPFKNLYPFGSVGVSVPPGTGVYWIRQRFHPSRPNGTVYVNLDFRTTTNAAAGTGRHRFLLGAQEGPPLLEVLLASDSLTLAAAGDALSIPLPRPGGWHNLQVALDLSHRKFSGCIGIPGQIAVVISPATNPRWMPITS